MTDPADPVITVSMSQLRQFFETMKAERDDAKGLVRLDEDEMKMFLAIMRGDKEHSSALLRMAAIEKKVSDRDLLLYGPTGKSYEGLVHEIAASKEFRATTYKVLWLLAAAVATLFVRWAFTGVA